MLGIDDCWSSTVLLTNTQNQNSIASSMHINNNAQLSSSQPSSVRQNSNQIKIELVIYYLNVFKYPNIPKQSIFQTMTSNKNWIQLLQILLFLAYDVIVSDLKQSL
jgi:hypothetical protein